MQLFVGLMKRKKQFYKLHSAALKWLRGGGSPTVMLYTHMLLSLYKDGAIGKRRSYVRKRFYPLSMSPPSPLQTRSFVHSSLSAPVHNAAQVFHFSKSRSRLCCCPCTHQTNPLIFFQVFILFFVRAFLVKSKFVPIFFTYQTRRHFCPCSSLQTVERRSILPPSARSLLSGTSLYFNLITWFNIFTIGESSYSSHKKLVGSARTRTEPSTFHRTRCCSRPSAPLGGQREVINTVAKISSFFPCNTRLVFFYTYTCMCV